MAGRMEGRVAADRPWLQIRPSAMVLGDDKMSPLSHATFSCSEHDFFGIPMTRCL